jgi:archaetidylinositol phosphate synthase
VQASKEEIAYDQRLARLVVRVLKRLPITPNQVTGTSLVLGLGAAVLLALGDRWIHWGAGLFVFSAWLDHCDGELARATGRTSRFGHYFDYVASTICYSALFLGAGIGLRDTALDGWSVSLGIAASAAIAAIFLIRLWVELRDGAGSIRQAVLGGFEMEDAIYLVAPVTWLGGLRELLIAAAIGAPLFLIWVAWDAFARRRQPA